MKFLFAATPVPGHVNPLLAIVRMVKKRGGEALFATARHLMPTVEAAGARAVKLEGDADIDFREIEKVYPEWTDLSPQERLPFGLKKAILGPMEAQAATLRNLIASDSPDIIVADSLFCGTTPLFLDRSRRRPPIVACGISILMLERADGAPGLTGLPPARDTADRARYAAMRADADAFMAPVELLADAKLAAMGLPGLPHRFGPSRVLLADAYLQPTVPAFEYDFGPLPPTVHFIGALPPPPEATRPDWWGELDGARKVVLVTQGTAANFDFGNLVEPTLAALAGRDDVLVVVTTGGRPVENVRGPLPANARVAVFLDYEALLPKLDLLVTNGGYGTVSLALRAGVPIVAAGRTEDKAEVGARVAWSGVGIELPTDTPSIEEVRNAVARVWADPRFRQRARMMAADFATFDAEREIFRVVAGLVIHERRSAEALLAS